MSEQEKEQLRLKAKELWDDEWALRTLEFATGNEVVRAFHTVDQVQDGLPIRDILWLEEGEFVRKRFLIDETEYVAELTEDQEVDVPAAEPL